MPPLLRVTSASVRARLCEVSLELHAGELLAVVGPNGAGKSSLIAACLGRLPLESGTIELGEEPVERLRPRTRAAHLGWLPQQDSGASGLLAVEVVAAARYRFGERHARALEQARRILAERELAAFADRSLESLSGGERQRVRLAALAAQEARVWLLDEPGNHLDPASQLGLWSALVHEVHKGLGALVITHDVTLLAHLGGVPARVLAMAGGRVQWLLPAGAEELPSALGELLGLRLHWVDSERGRRLVILGRR